MSSLRLWYDNTELNSVYNCSIFRIDSDYAPARLYNHLEIPGRSGDLLLDEQRYENVEMSYMAVFSGINADSNCRGMINFLTSRVGYKKLQDSEHFVNGSQTNYSSEHYMAILADALRPIITPERQLIKVEITFQRKPQRYLYSGTLSTNYTAASNEITNPTLFASLPKITVVGTGTLKLNDQDIVITGGYTVNDSTRITIDSEMMDCYFQYGSPVYNLNQYVSFSDNKFPVLKQGVNTLVIPSGISSCVIVPRWWKL